MVRPESAVGRKVGTNRSSTVERSDEEPRAQLATSAGSATLSIAAVAATVRPLNTVLAIVAAFNLAVAQPVLDLVGRNPEFLVAHDAGRLEVVLLPLILALAAPLFLGFGVVLVHRLHAGAGTVLRILVLAMLFALLFIQVLDGLGLSESLLLLTAVVAGLAVGVVATLQPSVRGLLGWSAVVVVGVVGMFVFVSPAAALLGNEAPDRIPLETAEELPPVVLIVFDELPLVSLLDPDGELDERAFPGFAALAEDATFYRNAVTTYAFTEQAVPAMLSGVFPERDELLPIAADHPNNLFTLLGSDYEVSATEPITQLCPPDLCDDREVPGLRTRAVAMGRDLGIIALHTLLPESRTADLPAIDEGWRGFGEGDGEGSPTDRRELFDQAQRTHRGRSFLKAGRAIKPGGERPRLDVIHALLPHARWEYLPTGQVYPRPAGMPGLNVDKTWGDTWQVKQSYQRHLLQVGYVDRLVGQTMDRLKARGVYDDALIIITADHGVSFRPGQPYRHFTEETFGEVAWVPLFVKLPRNSGGGTDDRPVMALDVVPTILDVVGADLNGYDFDGMSLLGDIPAERERSRPRGAPLPPFDVALRDAALEEKFDIFPSLEHGAFPRLVPRAPLARLIGRPVEESTDTGAAQSELEDPWGLAAVDPNGPFLPTDIRGTLRLKNAGDIEVPVAVSLNGTIQAVTLAQPAEDVDGLVFSAMVPPDALQAGANTVVPFVVSGSELLPAPVANSGSFEVDVASADVTVRRPDGKPIVVSADQLGEVNSITRDGEHIRVRGWAADVEATTPADAVLVVAGGEVVGIAPPREGRPELAGRPRLQNIRMSGFSVWVPAEQIPHGEPVSVVAVVGDRAAQLPAGRGLRRPAVPLAPLAE